MDPVKEPRPDFRWQGTPLVGKAMIVLFGAIAVLIVLAVAAIVLGLLVMAVRWAW